MKALSIKQPWAWLIVHGFKPVENRTWRTSYRGPVLIHAPLKLDISFAKQLESWSTMADDPTGFLRPSDENLQRLVELYPKHPEELEVGGVVGKAEIVDCVDRLESPWFTGPHGFVLANPKPLPFMPCRGMLGFFDPGLWAFCRECGCTDNDCSGCIERTGDACHWVEPDLCSACARAA